MVRVSPLVFLAAAAAFAAPVHLRTNSLRTPLAIDAATPVFSWQSDARTPDWTQSAYEVLVATKPSLLQPDHADAWDSGKIASSESLNIAYAGAPLQSQQHYVWKVITWDRHGTQSVSTATWFETGLRDDASWKAQWIKRNDPAAEREMTEIRWIWLPGGDAMQVPSASPAHFRYMLHLEAQPLAGSLHVLGRGTFIAHVNGKVSGHHSDWGAFDREEIVHLLHAGDNEIEIDFTSHQAGKPDDKAPAALAAAIHLILADGTQQRIVSDGQWQARAAKEADWQPAQVVGPMSLAFGIGIDRQTPIPGPDRVATTASLFRKDFTIDATVQSARLTITALGAYQAHIDGQLVSPNTLLAPGWTDFHKRVLYQTYDVTSMLAPGAHALGIVLGGGWYSSPLTWTGIRNSPGPNLLRAQLDVTLANGKHEQIVTDATWQTAPAPVTFSEIYGGESYDARLEQRGWSEPNYIATAWSPAQTATPPDGGLDLTAQPDLSVNTAKTLHPVKLDPENSDHPAIFDMGQNMVGNIRIHVRGERGVVVRMRYAERLNPGGSLYTENLRNADATDTYTLAGNGDEVWTPSFTFHGFRYVELTFLGSGSHEAATLATIDGLVFNSLPRAPSVRLTSSSKLLNKMNELGAWGQRGNFVSIPTDCPQRDERLGWMGDAGAFWRTGTYNFDIDAFTHKFMLDVTDAQEPTGAFTDVSPNILGPTPGAPGWGDAGIFIPYATWLQYGDTALLERSWPAMERWMDFIATNNPDFIRRNAVGNNYADWLAPDQNTPRALIDTAYWALVAREMVEIATALHHPEAAAKYQQQYGHIADAYRTAFVKPDGSVEGNTQTAYLATVFTGIAPPSQISDMVDRLVKDVQAHGNHLTTGFLGTPFLLPVLDENGHADLAFKLLLTDTYPSWGYMVNKGATTWWERWNGDTGDPSMNSYNHYAFGSVMAWVYRRAAGIDTDATGPGYHHLTIQPHFDPALPQLHVEYDSAYGTIVSDWKQKTHTFSVDIPANTAATVTLPGDRVENVGSGHHAYVVAP